MVIFQIVPKMFPAIDGLGDYAMALACQLREDFAVETHFVVGDLSWNGGEEVNGFRVSQIAARTKSALLSILRSQSEASSVLLHYAGYGYARRGCPIWLLQGLESFRIARPKSNIVTMFHETFGSGPPFYGADPPWTSAFWLSPLQKNLVSRLVRLSSHTVTSRSKFKESIQRISQSNSSKISLLPVFSNVGEIQQPPILSDRLPRLIVFGSRNSRARVYQQFPEVLNSVCEVLEIKEVYDIGSPTDLDPSQFKVPILSVGAKNASEVGEILRSARAGILNYHPDFLAKSGVYAAFSAYQVLPILVSNDALLNDSLDGIEAEKHYWFATQPGADRPLKAQAIADNAYVWYQAHRLSVQAQVFAQYLLANESP